MEFNLSYLILDKGKSKWVLFLHGWGSSKELMKNCFENTFDDYNHLYVDLPGFGNSSNDYVLSSTNYASIIKVFLDSLKISPKAIVGHSFGGKISTILNPKILVLLSSSGILSKKRLSVRLKIKLAKLFKIFGFKNEIFRTKDALNLGENMYESLKIIVNEDFTSNFANFKNRAFIFWGSEDYITPIESGKKIHSLIKDSNFHPISGDHFFFLNHSKDIDRIVNGAN